MDHQRNTYRWRVQRLETAIRVRVARLPLPGGSAGSSRVGAGIARSPESALVDRSPAAEQLHKVLSSD
jgi:hypothetical protein